MDCGTSSDNLQNLDNSDCSPRQVADQSLPDSEPAATWSFCTLVQGEEWDPSLLTSLFNEHKSTLAPIPELGLKLQRSSHMHAETEVL